MRVHSKKNQQPQLCHGQIADDVTIWVIELLDASGSMDERDRNSADKVTKYVAAEHGINAKIQELQKDKNASRYEFGVTEFDSGRYTHTIPPQPLSKVKDFSGVGPYGGTPLYESIAKTINVILSLKEPDDRVLLSIYTDGEENSSQGEWSRFNGGAHKLHDLIEKVKKENNFTVTFVGTKFDVEHVVKDLGISRGNTYTYDGTAKGMKMSMHANVGSTMTFTDDVVTRGMKTTENFYTKSVEEDDSK